MCGWQTPRPKCNILIVFSTTNALLKTSEYVYCAYSMKITLFLSLADS